MTNSSQPVPQRIGDVERDEAVEHLREHLAQGRIDQAEFDERLDVALTARFADQLTPLFADLPAPKPGEPSTTVAVTAATTALTPRPASGTPTVPDRTAMALGTLTAMAWPIAIVAMVALNSVGIHSFWFIWLLPLFMTGAFGRYRGGHRR